MLKITIPDGEGFNEETNEFTILKGHEIQLEHSLVSLSKWESVWKKPFLTKNDKSTEESIDYIRCMTITQNVDPKVYSLITQTEIDKVKDYIADSMTATTFTTDNHKINREIITAEVIYYWMIALDVPFECQKWHLNRLLTLINVCNIKNQPIKKGNKQTILNQQRELNKTRRAQLNTTG
ncbi:TPA: hypothetical protein DCQ22_03895 [Candidatus Nomurabacteria bacterium]|nr:hypothetical protein [Candidatus Nomurabacteria bacterium]